LIGVVALVQQVYAARGDILRKRVEYLFATRHSVSPPLIDYVESFVKRNAIYSSDTQNLVEILEYGADLLAYRVSMRKSFVLHNGFGDLEQTADLPLVFAPDLVEPGVPQPLAELTLLETSRDGQVTSLLTHPEPIPADGLRRNCRIRLRQGDVVTVAHEHWTWANNVGNSGFSLRRFSEHTRVTVRNRSLVTAQIFRAQEPDKVFGLKYGEEVTIREETNVPEMVRLDFNWLPPLEFPKRGADQRGSGVHPILHWNPVDVSAPV
jgi:hypothetical protein